jgi:outer membrane autotransporter protein
MVNVSLADTTDADGIDVQFGSQTSAIGRADARVGREFGAGEKRVRPYVRAGLEGVSGGSTAVTLSGYRFNGSGVGNSWIAGTGIDARFGKSTTLSVDGGYRGNLGAAGAEGLEGNLTFKKAF